MLPFVDARYQQIELGHVGVGDVLIVQASKARRTDQYGRRRQLRGHARHCTGVTDVARVDRRQTNVTWIGRVVDGEPRLDTQNLVIRQNASGLIAGVSRQHEVRPGTEDDTKLALYRDEIVATERLVGMIEIAHVAVARSSSEC